MTKKEGQRAPARTCPLVNGVNGDRRTPESDRKTGTPLLFLGSGLVVAQGGAGPTLID